MALTKMFTTRKATSKIMLAAIMIVCLPAVARAMFTRPDESSLSSPTTSCTANHPLVGVSAHLNTRAHKV